MEHHDPERVLKGHLRLSHVSSLLNQHQPDFSTWTKTAFPDLQGWERASLFALYRIDLVRQLLELGHGAADVQQMSVDAQRSLLASSRLPGFSAGYDWNSLFEAALALDMTRCSALVSEALDSEGAERFVTQFCPSFLQEVGRRWRHGGTTVVQEHFLTMTIRSKLSVILSEQRAVKKPVLRMLVTTPSGEQHELGAMMATIAAQQAGIHGIFLGPQLPVSEVMSAADCVDAHIVCLACSALDRNRLAVQVAQLREVLPDHVLLCLGGAAMQGGWFEDLDSTLVYDDLPHFAADMRSFTRLATNWFPH